MFNFNNLKLRQRILWGYSVPLALTLAATTAVVLNANKVEKQAKGNGARVESIVAAVNNIVMNNQRLSLTAKQQAVAIEQVVVAMNVVNEGAVQTASGISQTKISVQRLNEAAQGLQEVV